MNRHGHKRRRADPQTEIEKDFNVEMNEIDRFESDGSIHECTDTCPR